MRGVSGTARATEIPRLTNVWVRAILGVCVSSGTSGHAPRICQASAGCKQRRPFAWRVPRCSEQTGGDEMIEDCFLKHLTEPDRKATVSVVSSLKNIEKIRRPLRREEAAGSVRPEALGLSFL